MRISISLAVLAAAGSISAQHAPPKQRTYDTHDYYAILLDPWTHPSSIATHLGLEHDGPLNALPEYHVFRTPKQDGDVVQGAIDELKRRRKMKRDATAGPHILDGVLFNQKQALRKRLVKRGVIPERRAEAPPSAEANAIRFQAADTLQIKDPIFNDQWHLFNTQEVNHDLNITGVWLQGITGKNATVCIIDDGLDMDSLDLKPNYYAPGSYDFNDQVDEPKPRLSDDQHGTRCAGEVAAARNDVCGIGVAYDSRIAGIRILSKPISDIDEADSIVYQNQLNDIYSCSWGPPDDGKTMEGPGILIKQAFVRAVQQGRGGKGTVYVFAAGNGANNGDNCNFDGYTNSIYSITVGAIDKTDNHPYYSEACSAQLVVTYSSGSSDAIHTTDVGTNKCTVNHGGTSAAGPLGAGVMALVLSMRPDLSWRDLQWLTVMSAVPFDAAPNDWQTTTIGRKFSHQYGYGKLDAFAIVEAAKTWKNVNSQAWLLSSWIHVKHPIPEGDQGVASTFTVTQDMLTKANLKRLEHVTVTMNVGHMRRGDISVELRSPSGIVSHLSVARAKDDAAIGYEDWTFMSVAHWGESGVGDWMIVVKDTVVNQKTGIFTDWRLNLFGESINDSPQTLLPIPDEHDDDNHDVILDGSVTTISISVPTGASNPSIHPSALPTRPAISKPGEGQQTTVVTISPAPTGTSDSDTAPSATVIPDESFLPSPFPTFGVKKRTQVWIYGALSLIVIFIVSLSAYMYVQRRKRLRNNLRESYEFEMLDDQDDDAGAGGTGRRGMNGAAAGKKGKRSRRAGELYDAFAGESDEDLDLLSESEADEGHDDAGAAAADHNARYRDRDERKLGQRYRDDEEFGENEKLHDVGGDSESDSEGSRARLNQRH